MHLVNFPISMNYLFTTNNLGIHCICCCFYWIAVCKKYFWKFIAFHKKSFPMNYLFAKCAFISSYWALYLFFYHVTLPYAIIRNKDKDESKHSTNTVSHKQATKQPNTQTTKHRTHVHLHFWTMGNGTFNLVSKQPPHEVGQLLPHHCPW